MPSARGTEGVGNESGRSVADPAFWFDQEDDVAAGGTVRLDGEGARRARGGEGKDLPTAAEERQDRPSSARSPEDGTFCDSEATSLAQRYSAVT